MVVAMEAYTILLIGYLAVFFQAVRYIPQVIKGFKTKKVHDISTGWLVAGTIAALLWITYGIFIVDYPIILGNIINLACYGLLLYQKRMYK